MVSQTAVLHSCLHAAADAARPALERCIDGAVAVLQAAEAQSRKVVERDGLARSWRYLYENKAAWSARYQADLLTAFTSNGHSTAISGTAKRPETSASGSAKSAARHDSLGLDALSLVQDAELAHAIEASRLLQHIFPRVEQTLTELDMLISSALGLVNVRPDLNPVRPEVFAQVLQHLMSATPVEPELISIWIRHLGDPLGRELQLIYRKIIRLLESSHIQAANYRVLQTPSSRTVRAPEALFKKPSAPIDGSGPANADSTRGYLDRNTTAAVSRYADLSNFEIKDEMFQDFLFHDGSNADDSLGPSYYADVDEELAELRAAPDSAAIPLDVAPPDEDANYRAVPAVDRPQRFVDMSRSLSAGVWGQYGRSRERAMVRTQLKKDATKVGQVLGLEVVRKLVNQVAQDPRLLVPVREAIVALEPSLLRLAMLDPRFFSDEGHPGRRLMERVAQRSFKYNDEYSAEFTGFFRAVTKAFNELNAQTIDNAQPFGTVLALLEHAWDEQDQLEFQTRQKVLQALHFAEERQDCAGQIAFNLSARSDLEKVPPVVLDFLFGPWSLAMAHAKLVDQRNQVDPEEFGSVVPDLLWSVKRDVTLKRPAKLIEMIPGLLERLHSGLSMLGQDPKESGEFFESLMKLHQPVLKLRRLKIRRDTEDSGLIQLEAEEFSATPEQRRDRLRVQATEAPWLGRQDLDAAGFEDTLPTAPGELAAMDELPTAPAIKIAVEIQTGITNSKLDESLDSQTEGSDSIAPAHTQLQAEKILLSLRTGNWVDLYSKRRWLRAQLIWASSKATLFMFLSHGGQPHSMTRRSCEKLVMQRLLRPVNTVGVVAHALDAVASEVATQTPHRLELADASAPSSSSQQAETV